MRSDLSAMWPLVWLALASGCTDPGPPPHPPPHPELDVVVEGESVTINGTDIGATEMSTDALSTALGAQPSGRKHILHRWNSEGMVLRLPDPSGTSPEGFALGVRFQPYGLDLDGGMRPFRGRFIVNGAWVHPSAKKHHLEQELGMPCSHGNQGWGRFARSPFDDSWLCKVRGTRLDYWMKYRSNKDQPLAAFTVSFGKKPYPNDPPPPGFGKKEQGILKAFWDLF